MSGNGVSVGVKDEGTAAAGTGEFYDQGGAVGEGERRSRERGVGGECRFTGFEEVALEVALLGPVADEEGEIALVAGGAGDAEGIGEELAQLGGHGGIVR